MSFKQRDNSGTLFKNEKKSQDNQPDYDGTVLVGGVEYRIAAWIKAAETGRKFMSLSFTPKGGEKPADTRTQGQRRQFNRDDTPPF
jgi:hypothetical protein